MKSDATDPSVSTESPASLLALALGPVQRELEQVSQRMEDALKDPLARRVVYLIAAGGKRLRPALVLLTGLAGPSPRREALIDAAAAVELIHTATLIHDDIIDLSTLRRQQPTFHARWGTERAVLTGDYLYATSFAILAHLRDPDVVQIMADVCQELSRGELHEVEARHRLDLSESEYFAIIRDKTASLTGACCRIGSVLGGSNSETVERWGAFGINVGIAFQIIDDCLDLTGDPQQLGKSVHSDLDKGTLSLPMIYLAQQLSSEERSRLFGPVGRDNKQSAGDSAVAQPAFDAAMLARVAAIAQASGAVDQARQRALALIDEAAASVDAAQSGPLALAMRALAAYAVTRRN